MQFRKENHKEFDVKSIWIAGDFFRDEFNIGRVRGKGPRFLIDETVMRPGGAANTLANARAICRRGVVGRPRAAIHCFQAGFSAPRTLRRWVQDDKTVFEYWDYQGGMSDPWRELNKKDPSFHGSREYNTLVVSEYDKGFSRCNVTNAAVFDLLVVDSRYRTAPIKELKHLAQTSIWRCTGTEYDEDWAQHFDYVVHTNHDGEIWVRNHLLDASTMIIPPTTIVVDPVGAGDTFTAALAAALTDMGEVDHTNVVDAARFASRAAASVCGKRFTARTDVRLES